MSRFDALLVKVLARFGVDTTAGDLADTRAAAETRTAAATPAAVPPPLPESPYACTPTRWGDGEETKAARPSAAPPAQAVSRRPRRRTITVRREPVPRGLLLP